MPRPRSSIRRPDQSIQPDRYAQRFHELKRDLDSLEYFCKGTVLKRMMKCGKAACACHSDPDKRHGPRRQARIDLGIAHLKLEQHKRIHTKAINPLMICALGRT